jgi:hypothetical protein
MSQNESAARTQHTRTARLKSLAARPALVALVAAGMIAGSTGMAVAATSSSAHPAALTATGGNPPTCQTGYIVVNNVCFLRNV